MDRDTNIRKRKVHVKVAGVELRLVTDEGESEVQQLARELDTKIETFRHQTGIADTSQLLALALLNLAKEMQMTVQTQQAAERQSAHAAADWIDRLSARIEAVL